MKKKPIDITMEPRRVMLDGVLMGTNVLGAIEIIDSEVSIVKDIMARYPTMVLLGGSDIEITVTKKSGINLSLRKHKMTKSYYLNISGNPLTFLRGSNTYGYAEADRQIVTAYRVCLEMVEKKTNKLFPIRIKEAIAARNININSIEFACYTKPVKDKEGLMDAWRYVYRTGDSSEDEHTSLLDLLNLKLEVKNKKHKSSVPLKIMSGDGEELIAMLQVYNKAEEIKGKGLVVTPDIENRLRLDLNLNYGWFRRKAINKKKLQTLKDLVLYVEDKGGWLAFLEKEFTWALNRTCLFHMWRFEAQPILNRTYNPGQKGYLKLSWETYFAMLDARARRKIKNGDRLTYLKGTDVIHAKLDFGLGPLLELDMSVVKDKK